jgi:hypothetical protein
MKRGPVAAAGRLQSVARRNLKSKRFYLEEFASCIHEWGLQIRDEIGPSCSFDLLYILLFSKCIIGF